LSSPLDEADLTDGTPSDDSIGADVRVAMPETSFGTAGVGLGSGGTVPDCSGNGGRNSVRSRRSTSGAGSTTRIPGRVATPCNVVGAPRMTTANTQEHPVRYAVASAAAETAAVSYACRALA
jgi:hypothetical protein